MNYINLAIYNCKLLYELPKSLLKVNCNIQYYLHIGVASYTCYAASEERGSMQQQQQHLKQSNGN